MVYGFSDSNPGYVVLGNGEPKLPNCAFTREAPAEARIYEERDGMVVNVPQRRAADGRLRGGFPVHFILDCSVSGRSMSDQALAGRLPDPQFVPFDFINSSNNVTWIPDFCCARAYSPASAPE